MEIRQPNPENLTNVTTPPQTPPQSTLNQYNVHRFKRFPSPGAPLSLRLPLPLEHYLHTTSIA